MLAFSKLAGLATIGFFAFKYPQITKFIDEQNQFFDEVNVYTKDIENLPMTRLEELEKDGSVYEILDPDTGRLKQSGWLARDQNIVLNAAALRPNENKNWLQEQVKVRHQTVIITFSPKKISVQRLFHFGINTVAITTHMLKAKAGSDVDPLESMADDLTTKEPMGIVYSDTSSLTIQPFNVTSDYMQWNLTEYEASTYDQTKYERVLKNYENNKHPHNFNIDFDIFIEHADEPLTLLQEQSTDGHHFMAWSSRLGLLSEGRHQYNAMRRRQDDQIKTLTNIVTYAGAPIYGQGITIQIQAAGFLPQDGEADLRFGFEFNGGIAGQPELSTANKNAFTIDGKLHKLGVMDIVDQDPRVGEDDLKKLHFKMRNAAKTPEGFKDISVNECEIWYEMQFKMRAEVPAVVVKVHEVYGQGKINGWCYAGEGATKHYLQDVDALLIFDSNVY